MNLALYGYGHGRNRQWLAVDLGVAFGHGDELPGVDRDPARHPLPAWSARTSSSASSITPCARGSLRRADRFLAALQAPVFMTPFAAALLEAKRAGEPNAPKIPVTVVQPRQAASRSARSRSNTSPSRTRSRNRTRSPSARRLGTVLHTGDWKLDPAPGVGPPPTATASRRSARKACSRSSAIPPTPSAMASARAKARSRKVLERLIAEAPQRVAVTTFASNVGAHPRGRRCRRSAPAATWSWSAAPSAAPSMSRASSAISKGCRAFLDQETYAHLPRNKVVALMTGSQGEPRAALARIAAEDHARAAARARRPRDLLLAHHPRQRAGGEQHHQRAGRSRRRGHHRPRRARPHLRPSAPRRAAPALRLDEAADRRAGARRGAASRTSRRSSRAPPACRRCVEIAQRPHDPACAGPRRDVSTTVDARPALPRRTAGRRRTRRAASPIAGG